MTRKSIVKHHFTYTTPIYISDYSGNEYHESFNYRQHKNFWCDNHPLEELYKKLNALVPHSGECEDPRMEAFRLIKNAHVDCYNNGTGNACRWAVTPEFKKSIRKLGLSTDIVKSLERRLSDVFELMGKGRNFGWVRPYHENEHMKAVEHLLTDVVYYTGKVLFEDYVLELEKVEDPYGEYENLQLVK